MSVLRRLSPFGLALLLLVGVSCTAGDTTGPVSNDQQAAPSFGLIGDLTGGLIPALGQITHGSGHDVMLQDFRTKLDLSPEQTDQIAVVLQDYSHYYESLQDQLDDLRSTGLSRILQILQPGQREKFQKMRAELVPQLGGENKK
jgi:Spy/CpxP family protein refolding chaperone